MIQFVYKAHNLVISSEIELPELRTYKGNADVTISFGKVPRKIDSLIAKRSFYQFSRNEFIYDVSGVAYFYIKNGDTIIIEKYDKPNDIEIRIFLLHRIWGILLLQRKLFAVHGCTILYRNKYYLFTGSSMSKTLLGSYFREQGIDVLSDSISLLQPGINTGLEVLYGFQNARYDPVLNFKTFQQPVSKNKLDKIFVLESIDVNDFTAKPMTRTDIFKSLFENILLLNLVKDMELAHEAFQYFLELSSNVNMTKINMPQDSFSLCSLRQYLEPLF